MFKVYKYRYWLITIFMTLNSCERFYSKLNVMFQAKIQVLVKNKNYGKIQILTNYITINIF